MLILVLSGYAGFLTVDFGWAANPYHDSAIVLEIGPSEDKDLRRRIIDAAKFHGAPFRKIGEKSKDTFARVLRLKLQSVRFQDATDADEWCKIVVSKINDFVRSALPAVTSVVSGAVVSHDSRP